MFGLLSDARRPLLADEELHLSTKRYFLKWHYAIYFHIVTAFIFVANGCKIWGCDDGYWADDVLVDACREMRNGSTMM